MDSFLRLCRGVSGKQQESRFAKIWSPGSDYEMFNRGTRTLLK